MLVVVFAGGVNMNMLQCSSTFGEISALKVIFENM